MNLLLQLCENLTKPSEPLVFTKEQCDKIVKSHTSITSHTFYIGEKAYVFFNRDHLFGYDRERKVSILDTVPTTTYFPQTVVPRPGVEDGIIADFDAHVKVFYENYQLIYSLSELLDLFGCGPNGDKK